MSVASQNSHDFEELCAAFFSAIEVLSFTKEEAQTHLGGIGPGIAWELKFDLENRGNEILSLYGSKLPIEKSSSLKEFLQGLKEMPAAATGRDDLFDLAGKLQSDWQIQRTRVGKLLEIFWPEVLQVQKNLNMDGSWLQRMQVAKGS